MSSPLHYINWMASIASHTSSPVPPRPPATGRRGDPHPVRSHPLSPGQTETLICPGCSICRGARAGAPRPTLSGSWIKRACRSFRVLLLDQRGTGHSSPIPRRGPGEGMSPGTGALPRPFRADGMVRDAGIRSRVLGQGSPWSLLGQASAVLRPHPSPCSRTACTRVYLTGGVAPLVAARTGSTAPPTGGWRTKNRAFFTRCAGHRQPAGQPPAPPTCACPTASA